MIIDWQQGEHLRVGKLLIARNRSPHGQPLIDGAHVRLDRADAETAKQAVNAAERVLTFGDCRHDLDHPGDGTNYQEGIAPPDPGPTWVIPDRQFQALARAVQAHLATEKVEHFGGLCFTRGRWSWTIGWQDARVVNPARWRWRYVRGVFR